MMHRRRSTPTSRRVGVGRALGKAPGCISLTRLRHSLPHERPRRAPSHVLEEPPMKTLPTIVLALSAFATVGVSAQAVYSGQADQERRERNREEALAHYRTGATTSAAR